VSEGRKLGEERKWGVPEFTQWGRYMTHGTEKTGGPVDTEGSGKLLVTNFDEKPRKMRKKALRLWTGERSHLRNKRGIY